MEFPALGELMHSEILIIIRSSGEGYLGAIIVLLLHYNMAPLGHISPNLELVLALGHEYRQRY